MEERFSNTFSAYLAENVLKNLYSTMMISSYIGPCKHSALYKPTITIDKLRAYKVIFYTPPPKKKQKKKNNNKQQQKFLFLILTQGNVYLKKKMYFLHDNIAHFYFIQGTVGTLVHMIIFTMSFTLKWSQYMSVSYYHTHHTKKD